MRFTPRKNEYAAVAEALETGVINGVEYEDATALAKAIVSHTARALLEREWWLNVVALAPEGEPPTQVGFGLYASKAEALKADPGKGFRRMTIPVSADPEGER